MRYFINLALAVTISVGLTNCARRMESMYDNNGQIKRTNIPITVFKDSAHTFNYNNFKGDSINITYLGCGGFSIKRNNEIILIDPFFTNPNFLFKSSSAFKMRTKIKKVSHGMTQIPNHEKGNVKAILVSHSHYDHLMDVPYIFEQYTDTNNTKLYCSQSSKNMINGVGKITADKITVLNHKTSDVNAIGERFWIENSTVRITPILTEHAPHTKHIKMYKGDAKPKHQYSKPLDRTRAGWWKEGQTYAFLIDFMKGDSVEFRIYLQSSAANPRHGWLHPNLKSEHPINMALVGIASFDFVDHYPESLIDHLQPEKLVLCHWEDFFKKYDKPNSKKKRVRNTKVHEAIRRVNLVYPYTQENKIDQFILPYPGVTVVCKN